MLTLQASRYSAFTGRIQPPRKEESQTMKRIWLVALAVVFVVACQKGHPVSVKVDERMNAMDGDRPLIEKIAVLPFVSGLNQADDPDGIAPATLEKFFKPALNERADYIFVSPATVGFAVEREGWMAEYTQFLKDYPSHPDNPDMEFLGRLAETLKVDAFLVPVVDTWYKDEVDLQESATATTTVGATISIVDARVEPGKIIFRATDEDYLEGASSDMADRSVTRSAGIVRADAASKLYEAPPYEDVAVKVVEALVDSLPPR
jgi:hypothetical protein